MAMTIQRKRWLLRAGTLVMLMVAVGIAVRGAAVRPPVIPKIALKGPEGGSLSQPATTPLRLHASDPLWKTPLRRPLYDPPPPPPKKIVKKKLPPLRAKLMGTIIEPGASKAMIGLPGGSVEFRSAGDPLGPQDEGAVIRSIGPGSIIVARGKVQTELKIEKPF